MGADCGRDELTPETLQQIAKAVRSLRYGTVQITVHDARVVQIDKVERIRLSPTDRTSEGSRLTDGR